jgi:hypothetical protein
MITPSGRSVQSAALPGGFTQHHTSMITANRGAGEGTVPTNPDDTRSSTPIPILRTQQLAPPSSSVRPAGCRHPIPPCPGAPRWRRCGRPKCCRDCRDLWAWMMAIRLRRSFKTLPPTHFLTLHPGASGATDKAFTKAITKFLKALKRRCPAQQMEYLLVNEWRHGVRHAHVLIRIVHPMSRRAVRQAVRTARDVAGVRCSGARVRNVMGAANYIFKHTKRLERKAELTPAGFRGRMYTVSKGFLTKPFKELWQDVQKTRRAPGSSSDAGSRPAPATGCDSSDVRPHCSVLPQHQIDDPAPRTRPYARRTAHRSRKPPATAPPITADTSAS